MLIKPNTGPSISKRVRARWFGAFLVALVTFSAVGQAGVDMFLDLGREIPGESKDPNYRDKVDVLAWSWGMANSGSAHVGGGGGAGKVTFQDLSLTKYVDKASPKLMSLCASGGHLPTATLIIRKPGQEPVEYIKITLSNVLVSSVSTGGSAGEDRLTENVTLNFARVKFEYVPTRENGLPDKAVEFGWDVAANTPY